VDVPDIVVDHRTDIALPVNASAVQFLWLEKWIGAEAMTDSGPVASGSVATGGTSVRPTLLWKAKCSTVKCSRVRAAVLPGPLVETST